MGECKFKEREVVAVLNYGKPTDITRVKRVMARFVELANGSKWTLDGLSRYPRVKWDAQSIVTATVDHGEFLRRKRLTAEAHNVEWSTLTTDQLRRVMAIVNEGKEPTHDPR